MVGLKIVEAQATWYDTYISRQFHFNRKVVESMHSYLIACPSFQGSVSFSFLSDFHIVLDDILDLCGQFELCL